MSVKELGKPLSIREEAEREIREEAAKKAKEAIKRKLRDLEGARAVVRNIEREIEDLEASISDGSFVG
jgi:hypothetical protein